MGKQHNLSATTACMYFMFHLVFNLFSAHGKDTQRYWLGCSALPASYELNISLVLNRCSSKIMWLPRN